MEEYRKFGKIRIEKNSYAEAFDGIASRILVTADRIGKYLPGFRNYFYHDPLSFAAWRSTSTPSTVVGRLEAGIESKGCLNEEETPDHRKGAVLQFWGELKKEYDIELQVEKFYKELSIRIRQDILCTPTTRVFDWMPDFLSDGKIEMENRVGRCGHGYEYISEDFGTEMINIPLMSGYDWQIEKEISFTTNGLMGATLWIMGKTPEETLLASYCSLQKINEKADKVITPFLACPAGSSQDFYEPVGPASNLEYCPTLKEKMKNSKVPEGVNSIYEIVIDGLSRKDVERAMRIGINCLEKSEFDVIVSAGNYGGKLGKHIIYLDDLI
jgi:formylmethanofuran--tetrahydromethanopterin N-formyltransferase